MRSSNGKARLAVVLAVVGVLLAAPLPLNAQLCGEAEAPACDGGCPPDQACVPSGAGCACVPTGIPCGFLQGGPACHGFCPSGFPLCVVGVDLECLCIPVFTPTPTETPSPSPSISFTPTRTSTPEPTATTSPTKTPTAATFTPTPVPCVGDCDRNRQVTVDEIVRAVNIALGNSFISTCRAVDPNGDEMVTVDEIVRAVNSALHGCG